MSNEGAPKPKPEEIKRRDFLKSAGMAALGAAFIGLGFNESQEKKLLGNKYYEHYIKDFERVLNIKAANLPNQAENFISNCIYCEKIENEYGIVTSGKSEYFFNADIKPIYEVLQTLPPFAIKKSGFKEIVIAPSMPGSGSEINHTQLRGLFNKDYPNISAYHELAHIFDMNQEQGFDERGWTELNKNAAPYLNLPYSEINDEGKKSTGDVEGYADPYAYKFGIDEDKATISACLFTQDSFAKQVKRAESDPTLKEKLEFMAGYRIQNGKFTSEIPEAEYDKKGFRGLCYWRAWSRDDKNITWLDAEYFNAITRGKKVIFREEDGKTIREINRK